MADTLSSASITNLDQSPVVENTTGSGAIGFVKDVSDYVTPTTGGLADTSSKYKLVRLSFNAKLKELKLIADGALDSSTGLVLDVGAYYSDSKVDGTPAALRGTVISVDAFSSANAGFKSSAVGPIEALNSFSVAKRNQPLWQALGLSDNPGGFVDVVVAVHTAATTAVSNNLGAAARVVQG